MNSPDMASSGHKQALQRNLEPDIRVQAYSELFWTLIDFEGPVLVLPDSIAVSVNHAGHARSPFFERADEASRILFPVSSYRIFVGSKHEDCDVTSDIFNRWAAESSWDLFISNPEAPFDDELRSRIRYGTLSFLSGLMSQTFAQALSERTA